MLSYIMSRSKVSLHNYTEVFKKRLGERLLKLESMSFPLLWERVTRIAGRVRVNEKSSPIPKAAFFCVFIAKQASYLPYKLLRQAFLKGWVKLIIYRPQQQSHRHYQFAYCLCCCKPYI